MKKYKPRGTGHSICFISRTTNDNGLYYVLSRVNTFDNKRYNVQIRLGRNPQIEAKYAYYKNIHLTKSATKLERWKLKEKLRMFEEYFRMKSLVEKIKGVSNE